MFFFSLVLGNKRHIFTTNLFGLTKPSFSARLDGSQNMPIFDSALIILIKSSVKI
jgi:hypothetical protein